MSSACPVVGTQLLQLRHDDVSFYNSTASSWTLATPRTTWESVLSLPLPEASVPHPEYYSVIVRQHFDWIKAFLHGFI